MVRMAEVLRFMFPQAMPLLDYAVVDVGKGPQIVKWNPEIGPQPTQKEIDEATPAAQAAADAKAAEAVDAQTNYDAAKQAYGDLQAIIDAIAQGKPTLDNALGYVAKLATVNQQFIKSLLRGPKAPSAAADAAELAQPKA